jgi:hypothetical protein
LSSGLADPREYGILIFTRENIMFQFARVLTLQGDTRETMPWALEVTAHVNAKTGLDVSLWGSVFGYPVGTIAWSTMVEGRAQLSGEMAQLATDNAYLDLALKAQQWVTGPAEDNFRSVVHGGPGDTPPAVGAVASVTEALAATGKMPEAVAWAVDMAQHASNVTGTAVSLLVNAYGDFGGMAFISTVADMGVADAAGDAVQSDSDYITKIGASSGLFVDGSAHQSLLRRIA